MGSEQVWPNGLSHDVHNPVPQQPGRQVAHRNTAHDQNGAIWHGDQSRVPSAGGQVWTQSVRRPEGIDDSDREETVGEEGVY